MTYVSYFISKTNYFTLHTYMNVFFIEMSSKINQPVFFLDEDTPSMSSLIYYINLMFDMCSRIYWGVVFGRRITDHLNEVDTDFSNLCKLSDNNFSNLDKLTRRLCANRMIRRPNTTPQYILLCFLIFF